MFTMKKNGKRYCSRYHNIPISAWDYIKEVLKECGFRMFQKASASEYIMKGCEDRIIVYVKFHDITVHPSSTVILLNDKEKSDQINIKWDNESDFSNHGDLILSRIRTLWNEG